MLLHIVLFFIAYSITVHFFNKIRNLPPSPFPTLPVVGHLHLLSKHLHRSLSRLSRRYGPIVFLRLGFRRVLVVSSPSIAEECFTKNDVIFANRPRFLAGKHSGYNFTNIFWAPYGDLWRSLRKLYSVEILSSHRLQSLSTVHADEVKLWVRWLYGKKEETVNLKSAFFEMTSNMLTLMIAGKRYYGENVEEVEAARFREIARSIVPFGSNVGDYVPFANFGVEKKIAELLRKRNEFMQDWIEEHRKRMAIDFSDDGGSKTLIEVMLSLHKSEPDFYTDQTIKNVMQPLLLAGTDTSARIMERVMSLLVNNPEILKKAQSEIDSVIGNDRLVIESDAPKLPYMHCIINEAMRMYPVGPFLPLHESSEECHMGGYRVPSGTMLFVNLLSIQNDPKIWDEPEKFKPERFEGVEGARDGFKFMPFGSGRRSCPGKGLALRLITLAVGSLLQCFEWERLSHEQVDMTDIMFSKKPQPLVLKCKPRSSMLKLLSQL